MTFEKGDVQAMPFEDGSFDMVISLNMLHYVDDPVAMLNEIEWVLAPSGMFGLGAIKRSWLALIWPIFRMAYTAEEAVELIQRSKLRTWELRESFLVLTVAAGSSVGLQS